MTCSHCEGLHFVPCPRAPKQSVCTLACTSCKGKHVVPCPDCEAHQEHEEVSVSAEADSILRQMDEALGPLGKRSTK